MVKLTMVGRVRDGLPIAQGIRYVNEENDDVFGYKKQAEFILKEISRGTLSPPKMVILMHHHSFMYLPLLFTYPFDQLLFYHLIYAFVFKSNFEIVKIILKYIFNHSNKSMFNFILLNGIFIASYNRF